MVNAPAENGVKTLDFPRFGTCTFSEDDVFVFPWGMPGFDELRTFLVLQIDSQPDIVWLQCLDDLSVSLPLGDPWTFFPDYDPQLPAFARISLDLEKPEDFLLLAVMVGTSGGRTFMNLMAPVVLNLKRRIARQVPLEGSGYTVAQEIAVPDFLMAKQAEENPG
jgi:flagellar assembly factor FliW